MFRKAIGLFFLTCLMVHSQKGSSISNSFVCFAPRSVDQSSRDIASNITMHIGVKISNNNNTNKVKQIPVRIYSGTNSVSISPLGEQNNATESIDNSIVSTTISNLSSYSAFEKTTAIALTAKQTFIDAHNQIANCLEKSQSLSELCKALQQNYDMVFTSARQQACDVPEQEAAFAQVSINSIPEIQSDELMRFATEVGQIARFTEDMQIVIAQQKGLEPTLLERTPNLLARATLRFFARVHPAARMVDDVRLRMEMVVAAMQLSRWTWDITVGQSYLSPEQIAERKTQFNNFMDGLKNVGLDEAVDISAAILGDIVYTRGCAGTMAYLKELGQRAQEKACSYAHKLKEGVARAVQEKPSIITPEGIIWRAPKGLVLENRSTIINNLEILEKESSSNVVAALSKNKTIECLMDHPVVGGARVGSATKSDFYHAFPDIIDNFARYAKKFVLTGNDGRVRDLYQIKGSLNGISGIFEWIHHPIEGTTHRLFIENGAISGIPNMHIKR